MNAASPMKILLYGGTVEGRTLAEALDAAGVETLVSVATETGENLLTSASEYLSVRRGGLGVQGMESLMREGFSHVIDATHPYAVNVSAHLREAAGKVGLPYIRVVRESGDMEGCTVVDSLAEAVASIDEEGNVLSTTGSKEIAAYADLPNYQTRLYARVLDAEKSVAACEAIGLEGEHIIAERGPFTVQHNVEQIKRFDIATLVTKDGGKEGGYPEKLEAARQCGVRMIVVRRPVEEGGFTVSQVLAQLGMTVIS